MRYIFGSIKPSPNFFILLWIHPAFLPFCIHQANCIVIDENANTRLSPSSRRAESQQFWARQARPCSGWSQTTLLTFLGRELWTRVFPTITKLPNPRKLILIPCEEHYFPTLTSFGISSYKVPSINSDKMIQFMIYHESFTRRKLLTVNKSCFLGICLTKNTWISCTPMVKPYLHANSLVSIS